jgi:hypothetical protein
MLVSTNVRRASSLMQCFPRSGDLAVRAEIGRSVQLLQMAPSIPREGVLALYKALQRLSEQGSVPSGYAACLAWAK